MTDWHGPRTQNCPTPAVLAALAAGAVAATACRAGAWAVAAGRCPSDTPGVTLRALPCPAGHHPRGVTPQARRVSFVSLVVKNSLFTGGMPNNGGECQIMQILKTARLLSRFRTPINSKKSCVYSGLAAHLRAPQLYNFLIGNERKNVLENTGVVLPSLGQGLDYAGKVLPKQIMEKLGPFVAPCRSATSRSGYRLVHDDCLPPGQGLGISAQEPLDDCLCERS